MELVDYTALAVACMADISRWLSFCSSFLALAPLRLFALLAVLHRCPLLPFAVCLCSCRPLLSRACSAVELPFWPLLPCVRHCWHLSKPLPSCLATFEVSLPFLPRCPPGCLFRSSFHLFGHLLRASAWGRPQAILVCWDLWLPLRAVKLPLGRQFCHLADGDWPCFEVWAVLPFGPCLKIWHFIHFLHLQSQ